MYQVKFDPFYELELEQILDDIVMDYSPDFAQKVVLSIKQHIENIKVFPKIYAVYGNIPKYRKFVVERKYTVFYMVDDVAQLIVISHIFPSVRDLPTLLN